MKSWIAFGVIVLVFVVGLHEVSQYHVTKGAVVQVGMEWYTGMYGEYGGYLVTSDNKLLYIPVVFVDRSNGTLSFAANEITAGGTVYSFKGAVPVPMTGKFASIDGYTFTVTPVIFVGLSGCMALLVALISGVFLCVVGIKFLKLEMSTEMLLGVFAIIFAVVFIGVYHTTVNVSDYYSPIALTPESSNVTFVSNNSVNVYNVYMVTNPIIEVTSGLVYYAHYYNFFDEYEQRIHPTIGQYYPVKSYRGSRYVKVLSPVKE